jgi:hypothetical protein
MAKVAGNTAPGALSGRQAVSLTLVAIMGALTAVLIDPVIGLPIAAAGLAGLAYTRRAPVSILAGVVGGLAAGGLLYGIIVPLLGAAVGASEPYVYTVLLVMSLLVVGPLTAALMRNRSALETMAVVTAVLTALSVLELSAYAAEAGQSVNAYVEAAVQGFFAQAELAEEVTQALVTLWPGALVTVNGLTAVLVVFAVGAMGARLGVALRRVPPLAVFDLDVRMAILPIVAIALLAAGRLPVDIAPSLEIVGSNLLMVARLVFFLQGVAVFAGLYERAKFSRPARMAGFVLLGVTEAFAPAVSLTGLADMWLNLRRLPREASASGQSGTTPGND